MAKFGVKEVADVTFYDLVSNKPVLFLDTLKMTNLENTASSSDARGGRGNPKLLQWDFDREATMSVQDALMSEKSIALATGNDLITGAKAVHKREVLEVTGDATAGYTVTTSQTVEGTASTVFVYKTDDTATEVPVSSVSGSTVTLDTTSVTVTAGEQVAVYYKFSATNAQTMSITSDGFPGYYKIVGDTVVRDAKTGVDEPFQLVLHKAKLQPGFTMNFQADGDPSVFDMNLEVFRRDQDTSMIEMVKYE